jgi:hypothetical protein
LLVGVLSVDLHSLVSDKLALVILQVEAVEVVEELVDGVGEHLVVYPKLEVSAEEFITM